MLTLRVGRRKTSWEVSPIDELIKTEFAIGGQVDLNVSTYVVEASEVTRTVAEHSASFGANPRNFPNVDLAGKQVDRIPGETQFEFTRDAHHEMRFESEDELRTYLETVVRPNITERIYPAPRPDVVGYARGRLAEQDPEWVAFFAANTWPT